MKRVLRAAPFVVGSAIIGFAMHRIGFASVLQQLNAMSGGVGVILALSVVRLLLQTESWSVALRQDGIHATTAELAFLRLASQGIGYLTVLGPAASEPMKIKMLQHHRGSATAATLVDSGMYWLSAGLVLIAGSISATLVVAHSRNASIVLATIVAVAIGLAVQPQALLRPMTARLRERSPGWLKKAAHVEEQIRTFAAAHPAAMRKMFAIDMGCQLLLLAEIATALYCLHLPLRAGTVLSIEAAGRAVRLLGGWMPARIGADESGAAIAFAAMGFPAAAGLALAVVRRCRDLLNSVVGLIWLGWRTRTVNEYSTLRGAIECKL